MSISAEKCRESALKNGCNDSFGYSDIQGGFYNFNREILEQKRGAGYWLWKPYIIYRELLRLPENTILVYTDAGLIFENSILHLIKAMKSNIMVFDNRWIHGEWCKMDVLSAMGCATAEIIKHTQLQASCIILENTDLAKRFIKEWLCWCQMPGFIDDSPSLLKNIEGFREHRHDQAILTNLSFKYGLSFHWWPVQYCLRNKHEYNDNYPQIFQHHRKRNEEW